MFTEEVEMQDTNAEYDYESSAENLFCDPDGEESEETNEDAELEEENETEEEEEKETSVEETTETEQTLDYKYLGKTTPLPQKEISVIAEKLGVKPEDIIAQLQKGANYDESPTKKIVHRLAQANGMDDEGYMKFLGETATAIEDKKIRDKIVEAHPEWDDEKVEMQVKLNKIEAGKEAEQKAQQAEFDENKPFIEFLAKYPDFDVQKGFPAEVAADIQKGIHPIVAYESYVQQKNYEAKMAEFETKKAQEEKKQENRKRSVGSLKDNGGEEGKDSFLDGLLGRY